MERYNTIDLIQVTSYKKKSYKLAVCWFVLKIDTG